MLPCGAGKTVVGMTVMSLLKTNTLILTTNVAAVHQWIDELLDKTDLSPDDIGEYTGGEKTVRSVTVATYQIDLQQNEKGPPDGAALLLFQPFTAPAVSPSMNCFAMLR